VTTCPLALVLRISSGFAKADSFAAVRERAVEIAQHVGAAQRGMVRQHRAAFLPMTK